MSLLTSLASGTTGLSSASSELAVIGDNIANANTIGFKCERAAFEDALAQSVIGGQGQIGLGSRLQGVQKIVTQGALTNTGIATDLALQGSGFFEVRGTAGDGRTGTYLTRAGQFSADRDGYLVTLDGLRVQGYGTDGMGKLNTVIGDIQVGNATSAPRPSSTISVKANLQADISTVAAWDPTNPAGTSNWATSVTLYDAIGKAYPTQVYFRKDPANAGAWEWHAMADGGLVQGGIAGTPSQIAGGTLQFDSQGRLTAVTQASTFDPLGQATAQQLTFDFGSVYDPIVSGSGLQGITQFATASATTLVSQDGFGSGALTSIEIDKTGVVLGVFSNGQTRDLGQVGVARVTAPDQLERIGGNLFAATRNSGEPVIGAAGEGGRAFISSGTLEQSNVDIAEQFVRMIAAQRAFEANSKTITTSDQLLSELIQLKR